MDKHPPIPASYKPTLSCSRPFQEPAANRQQHNQPPDTKIVSATTAHHQPPNLSTPPPQPPVSAITTYHHNLPPATRPANERGTSYQTRYAPITTNPTSATTMKKIGQTAREHCACKHMRRSTQKGAKARTASSFWKGPFQSFGIRGVAFGSNHHARFCTCFHPNPCFATNATTTYVLRHLTCQADA
jgi:hypothetical protein